MYCINLDGLRPQYPRSLRILYAQRSRSKLKITCTCTCLHYYVSDTVVASFYDGVFTTGVYQSSIAFIFISLATVILALLLAVLNTLSMAKHPIIGPNAMLVFNITASKLTICKHFVVSYLLIGYQEMMFVSVFVCLLYLGNFWFKNMIQTNNRI